MAGGDAFEARYSPLRSLLLGLLALGFFVLGLWIIGAFGEVSLESRRYPAWLITAAGGICAVFFGPIGLNHFSRALSPGVAVRVDERGMIIPGAGAHPIPWRDFTEFSSQNMMGTNLLMFDVTRARLEKFGLFKRALWAMNEPFYGKGGSLVINNTNRRHQELVDAVQRFAPPAITRYLR